MTDHEAKFSISVSDDKGVILGQVMLRPATSGFHLAILPADAYKCSQEQADRLIAQLRPQYHDFQFQKVRVP